MFFLYDWIAWVAGLFAGNPLLLVFFLGIIGNVIPFVPTPSLLFIVVLVVTPGSGFQGVGIIEIASIAALGACIGKLVSYALGYGARRAIGKPERFDSLRRYLGGSTFLVGVVFAASPLVDTAFIAAINTRYNATVTDATSLQGTDGLDLDSVAVTTDFYGLVVLTVHDQGCRVRHLSPQTIAGCDTVGAVVDKVWADLSAPFGT